MDESTANTLSENLKALIANDKEANSEPKVAKAAGVDQTTVNRMIRKTHSSTLDKIAKVAAVFDLQAWQLLVPGLDPTNPPVVVSRLESEFFARLRKDPAVQAADPKKP